MFVMLQSVINIYDESHKNVEIDENLKKTCSERKKNYENQFWREVW
jgi:uncharacterized membrane-anchored protein YitT (DUF2179 family)